MAAIGEHIWLSFAIGCVSLLAAGGVAQAAVEISSKPTKNMSCSAGVCSPTARKAWLNAGDLANMLATSDVKVVTGAGATVIEITAPLSWVSADRLTLDSARSIIVKREVTVAGPGALTLTTNDGGTDGVLEFENKGSVTFWDLNSRLMINGQVYRLVSSIGMLASAVAANPRGRFALANKYNAAPDGPYALSPISTAFNGAFEGLGNTISNLTISSTFNGPLALFAQLKTQGSIAGVRMHKMTILNSSSSGGGTLAALVGFSYGTLVNTEATDVHIVAHPTKPFGLEVGGLVGVNEGTLSYSKASGRLRVSGWGTVGGLVAGNNGSIMHSSATVVAEAGNRGDVGGLAGFNSGTIVDSHSAGSATDTAVGGVVGGLVGENGGAITESSSSVTVTAGETRFGHAGAYGGGLAGTNLFDAVITKSFETGSVSGGKGAYVGGLVGDNGGAAIDQCYATGGATTGDSGSAGGLVGSVNDTSSGGSSIGNSYSLGAVAAGNASTAGGLIGKVGAYFHNSHTIDFSYSTGTVTSGTGGYSGGFVGYDNSATPSMAEDYWDLDTSGIGDPSRGAGNIANDPGITGLTDVQLKSALPDGFDSAIWGQNPSINNGYPYLRANPPPG